MPRKGKNSHPHPEDDDLRRKKGELEVSKAEAEVQKKWSEAEIMDARAHKAKKEAGVVEAAEEDNIDPEGGIVRDRFVTIWRHPPGGGWPILRRGVPADEIPSLQDYIESEGNPEDEHKCQYTNAEGKKLGKPIFFPAVEESVARSVENKDKVIRELERQIKDKDKDETIDVLRKTLKEKSGKASETPSMSDLVFIPHLGGWYPKTSQIAMSSTLAPWMQPQKDDTAELVKAFVPVIVALVQKQPEKSPLQDIAFIKMLIEGSHSGSLSPKDMVGMFTPFVLEMSKASGESNKIIMSAMADMDQSFRDRMLDIIMADPNKTKDEVARWERWLSFGEAALRRGAGVVRDAIGGATGNSDKKKIPEKKVPGLEGPKQEAAKQDAAKPEPEKPPDPKASGEALKKRRIEVFLLSMEEEMHAESDPELIAEKCEELYLSLPLPLRQKIEDAVEDGEPNAEKILDLVAYLKILCPEVMGRIASAVTGDGNKQEWVRIFLLACAFPEEENPEDGQGGEHEGTGHDRAHPDDDPEEGAAS